MNRFVKSLVCGFVVSLVLVGGGRKDALWAQHPPGVPRARPTTAPRRGGARRARSTTAPRRGGAGRRPWWSRRRRPWWDRFPPPVVKRIALPDFPGAHAIWGGTGTDSRGHVWFGVCATGVDIPSAHLFEFIPATGEGPPNPEKVGSGASRVIDRGDVVSALKSCGVYRQGEGQMKIHSKIVQADDGHLYFASMDEQDEDLRAEKLPTWGGHLWRLRLPERGSERDLPAGRHDTTRLETYKWEHLLTTPEALMTVAGAGSKVYALGYYGHVLYQYDCATGKVRSVKVGAADAHISRNFFTDRRGHVYVPRVKAGGSRRSFVATLVEFDDSLRELAETPLEHYASGGAMHSHGIIGFQPLKDGRIAFLTHDGYMYRVEPPASGDGPAKLTGVGWFHPRGSWYTPSLFTDPGGRYLMGVASRSGRFDWVMYSLEHRSAYAFPFTIRGPEPLWQRRTLLYGSVARDKAGRFYLGGRTSRREGKGFEPILVQVSPPRQRED